MTINIEFRMLNVLIIRSLLGKMNINLSYCISIRSLFFDF